MPRANCCVERSSYERRSKESDILLILSEHVDKVWRRDWWKEESKKQGPDSDLRLS